MPIGRVVAQVVNLHVQQPAFDAPTDHAFGEPGPTIRGNIVTMSNFTACFVSARSAPAALPADRSGFAGPPMSISTQMCAASGIRTSPRAPCDDQAAPADATLHPDDRAHAVPAHRSPPRSPRAGARSSGPARAAAATLPGPAVPAPPAAPPPRCSRTLRTRRRDGRSASVRTRSVSCSSRPADRVHIVAPTRNRSCDEVCLRGTMTSPRSPWGLAMRPTSTMSSQFMMPFPAVVPRNAGLESRADLCATVSP